MNTHPHDTLVVPDSAKLIFTPCPGTKGVDLATSVAQLRRAGADALITLMPDEELARFNASSLSVEVRQLGMTWYQIPVEDDAAPGEMFEQAWHEKKEEILSLVRQGQGVAIHCRGGSGRTGFMAAVILRELGHDSEETTRLVKSMRSNSLQLAEHIDYLACHYDTNNPEGSPL